MEKKESNMTITDLIHRVMVAVLISKMLMISLNTSSQSLGSTTMTTPTSSGISSLKAQRKVKV